MISIALLLTVSVITLTSALPPVVHQESLTRSNCEISSRFFDGTCTNPSNPAYGRGAEPVFSYIDNLSSETFSSRGRPDARLISNAVCNQEQLVFNDRNLNELLVFFGQFVDHDLVLSEASDERMPIPVPANDPNTEASFFPFRRNVRVSVPDEAPGVVRPENLNSQIIDLSMVYGSDKGRADAIRTFRNGRLKISDDNLLPLNTIGLQNDPDDSDNFYLAGDIRVNETPMLTVMHTLWVREHNSIIDDLLRMRQFRRLSDEGLYQLARKINTAQFQKVVWEEFFPAIVGRSLPRYRGFNPRVNPTVSNIFATAAFRIGHTMVGNGVQVLQGGVRTVLPLAEMFMRDQSFFRSTGLESFLLGAITIRCQEIDNQIVNVLRNGLFSNVPGFADFDLISLNIQRGRDHNIPSYNEVRNLFGIRRARSFADITSDAEVQGRLSSVYRDVDEVDAFIGLISEEHVRGSSIGVTMRAIWMAEFTRLRDGDQFFYLREGLFSTPLRRSVQRVNRLFRGGSVFRTVLLRNTNLSRSQVPVRPFFV